MVAWEYDGVDELEIPVLQGFEVSGDTAELARAAGLFLVCVVEVRPLRDRFPVGHTGLAGGHVAVIFAPHALDIDLEMQLPHPFDDRFPRFSVQEGLEGRIFLGEAGQGLGHADLRPVVLRHDGEGNDRLGDEHGGHRQRQTWGDEGVPRGAFDSEKGPDGAGLEGLDVLHLVGMHPHDAPDLDFSPAAGVDRSVPEMRLIDA